MSKAVNKTTSINIRLDQETRRRLQQFADQLGIPATTLAAANIKQMLRSREIRLNLTLEPTPQLKKLIQATEIGTIPEGQPVTINNESELESFFSSL